MRQAANQQGEPAMLSLWAGQGVPRLRPKPAGELVEELARELRSA